MGDGIGNLSLLERLVVYGNLSLDLHLEMLNYGVEDNCGIGNNEISGLGNGVGNLSLLVELELDLKANNNVDGEAG